MFCVAFVIPGYNERDWISATMASLQTSMQYTVLQKNQVHVIVVLNHPSHASADAIQNNKQSLDYLNTLKDSINFNLHVLNPEQALKHGVGEARKLGMDYASDQILKNNQNYIVSLDADTRISADYLQVLSQLPQLQAWTSYFEHPTLKHVTSNDESIMYYELYLRYLAQGLNLAGSDFSYVPIGSAFGLSKKAYQKSGGMILKDATEDFHFLNKLRKTVKIDYAPQLKVIPAARKSSRVYLGTGFYLSQSNQSVWIPRPKAFEQLQSVIKDIHAFWNTQKLASSKSMFNEKQSQFLEKLEQKLIKQFKNSSSEQSFLKRIPQSFDALDQMRFLKLSSHCYDSNLNSTFVKKAEKLLELENKSIKNTLNYYRKQLY